MNSELEDVVSEQDALKGQDDMTEQTVQNVVRAPWIFGARDDRHRGVEVENEGQLLTVSQAIQQGGLDWLVELRDPISNDADHIEAPDFRQVVKCENILKEGELVREYRTFGFVKGRYTPLQNREAFSFFDRATLEGAAIIKAVGHLDFGRVVWALAERPETFELYPGGDEIRPTLILLTAHDGSHAVKVMFAAYRASSGTMLSFRPKNGKRVVSEVRVRHTASVEERMLDLHNVLEAENGYFERWRAALIGSEGKPGFKQKLISPDEIKSVVKNLFPDQKKVDEDGKSYEEASAQATNARKAILDRIGEQAKYAQQKYAEAGEEAPQGITQLDVFLGISEFIDKDRTTRNETNNWVASTFGTGAGTRQKAFDLIAAL